MWIHSPSFTLPPNLTSFLQVEMNGKLTPQCKFNRFNYMRSWIMCLALWSSQSLIHNQPFWKSKSWCSGEMGIGNAGLGWQGKLWSHELLLPVGSVGSMKEGARAGSHHPWRNACVCRWGWKEQSRQVRTVRTQGQTKARTHIQREMIFLRKWVLRLQEVSEEAMRT